MRSISWKIRWMAPLVASSMAVGCGASSSRTTVPTNPTAVTPVAAASPPPAPEASSSSSAAPPIDTTDQEGEEASAELIEHHRHHHHGGLARFVAMSLDTLGVTPEQHATVEKIQAALQAKLEPARVAERKVVLLLADGIAAGKIDKAKADAAAAQVGAASIGVHGAIADALNQLHSVLTESQRAALVEKVEAHWEVWQEANESTGGDGEPREHGHLDALARELSLTPEQVEKIRAGLRVVFADAHQRLDSEKVTEHLHAFSAAFESPSFDAKNLNTADVVNAHLGTWGAARMAHFYEAVTPVLTAAQRTQLAEHVREHANHQDTPAPG
jgi:Spy/CpxP family protein refolding chaperone